MFTRDDIRRWPASVHKTELIEGVLIYQGHWPFEEQDAQIAARVYPNAEIQIDGDVMKVSTAAPKPMSAAELERIAARAGAAAVRPTSEQIDEAIRATRIDPA